MPPQVMQDAGIVELGSRFRTIDAQIQSLEFSEGNVRSIEIPKSFLHKALALRLKGFYDGTAGAAFIAGVENPLPLINRVEINADGRKPFVISNGRSLYRLSQIQHGHAGELIPPATATAVDQPFSASFYIDFEAVRMALTNDSLLDLGPYEKTELRVTWGRVTDIAVGGTPTIDAPNTFLDVQSLQTTIGVDRRLFTRLLSFAEIPVTATSTSLRERIPRSGLIHGALIRTTRDGAVVDNILNRVSVQSDNAFLHRDQLRVDQLRNRNTIDYQIAPFTSGTVIVPGPILGYTFVDFSEDGLMNSLVDTTNLNSFDWVFDVTRTSGTELINILYIFYEPLPILTAAA